MKGNHEFSAMTKYGIATPAQGEAAVITVAADANEYWVLDALQWSLDGVTGAATLTAVFGSTTLFSIDIGSVVGCIGAFNFRHSNESGLHRARTKGEALVVTLTPNAADTAKLMIQYR